MDEHLAPTPPLTSHLSDVEKQQALNWMLREVVMTNHDLLNSTSMEELWQRAVELARERLDVERCSVFLVKGKYLVGTYGTDHSRRTVDERGLKFVTSSLVRGLNLQSPTRNMPDWIVTENANLIEGDENSRIWVLRKGWLAATAIRVHAGPAMALFFNDTAISQTPFDPVKQDLIAVYCSLIGNVAERKLLEQQLTQRTHELSKLLDISKTIQSTLQLKPLFRQILQTLRDVLKYDSAFVFERTSNYDLVLTDVEDAPDDLTPRQWPFHPDDIHIARMFETRAPTLITDVAADTPEARSFRQRQIRIMKHTKATGSCLQVPLVVRDEVIGMISIRSFGSKVYTEEDANLALAFANQAAAALQSARLHTNAVVSAARDERLRLARDLHDSVSQAMFGINMGARTASHLLPPDSPARPSVEYVLNLSHIAKAELRALLLEMRPDAIHTEGLLVVLRQHIDAKAARSNSSVTVDLGTVEPPLSLEGKEMIYRVCIEALNNALKYAQASQIIVHIQVGPTCTDLDVRDNGIGFDTTVNFPGHFGLKGMRERAEKLGAVFHISSTIGAGTHASLRIQHEPQLCTR